MNKNTKKEEIILKKKQMICLALSLTMVFLFLTSAEADSSGNITPKLLSGWSAARYTQDKDSAALYAVFAIGDFAEATGYTIDDFNLSYGFIVIRKNSYIVSAMYTLKNGNTIFITYIPALESADYIISSDIKVTSASTMQSYKTVLGSFDETDVAYYISYSELIAALDKY